MQDTEARLLVLENKVKEQQEAIDSFDRMFLLTLEKFLQLEEDAEFNGGTIDNLIRIAERHSGTFEVMLGFLERIKPQIDDLWQNYQNGLVRKQIDMLN